MGGGRGELVKAFFFNEFAFLFLPCGSGRLKYLGFNLIKKSYFARFFLSKRSFNNSLPTIVCALAFPGRGGGELVGGGRERGEAIYRVV